MAAPLRHAVSRHKYFLYRAENIHRNKCGALKCSTHALEDEPSKSNRTDDEIDNYLLPITDESQFYRPVVECDVESLQKKHGYGEELYKRLLPLAPTKVQISGSIQKMVFAKKESKKKRELDDQTESVKQHDQVFQRQGRDSANKTKNEVKRGEASHTVLKSDEQPQQRKVFGADADACEQVSAVQANNRQVMNKKVSASRMTEHTQVKNFKTEDKVIKGEILATDMSSHIPVNREDSEVMEEKLASADMIELSNIESYSASNTQTQEVEIGTGSKVNELDKTQNNIKTIRRRKKYILDASDIDFALGAYNSKFRAVNETVPAISFRENSNNIMNTMSEGVNPVTTGMELCDEEQRESRYTEQDYTSKSTTGSVLIEHNFKVKRTIEGKEMDPASSDYPVKDGGFIEKQYFSEALLSENGPEKSSAATSGNVKVDDTLHAQRSHYIEQQYFGTELNTTTLQENSGDSLMSTFKESGLSDIYVSATASLPEQNQETSEVNIQVDNDVTSSVNPVLMDGEVSANYIEDQYFQGIYQPSAHDKVTDEVSSLLQTAEENLAERDLGAALQLSNKGLAGDKVSRSSKYEEEQLVDDIRSVDNISSVTGDHVPNEIDDQLSGVVKGAIDIVDSNSRGVYNAEDMLDGLNMTQAETVTAKKDGGDKNSSVDLGQVHRENSKAVGNYEREYDMNGHQEMRQSEVGDTYAGEKMTLASDIVHKRMDTGTASVLKGLDGFSRQRTYDQRLKERRPLFDWEQNRDSERYSDNMTPDNKELKKSEKRKEGNSTRDAAVSGEKMKEMKSSESKDKPEHKKKEKESVSPSMKAEKQKKNKESISPSLLNQAKQFVDEEERKAALEDYMENRSSISEGGGIPDEEKSSAFRAAEEIRAKLKAEMEARDGEINIHGIPKDNLKRDSKGLFILNGLVPDFDHATKQQVVDVLARRIIYDQDDVVAIDKPYGLPSHGKGNSLALSIFGVLDQLARVLDRRLDTLHHVHRLDKETTGVMLFAKSHEMAFKLREAFKERKVIKKYWLITVNVPVPEEATIDIPIGEGVVEIPLPNGKTGSRRRMVLLPDSQEEIRSVMKQPGVHRKQAITRYQVIKSYGSYALVECLLLTGVKHQIRAHMFYGLNTPVLGDHKYSHIDKMAPQKLHPDMLKMLEIQKSKVRHLPLHLHCKNVVIPHFLDGRNLFVQAMFPRHWKYSCKQLKIDMPEKLFTSSKRHQNVNKKTKDKKSRR